MTILARLPTLFRRAAPAPSQPTKDFAMSDTSSELPTALDFINKLAANLAAERKAKKALLAQLDVLQKRDAEAKTLLAAVLAAHEKDGGEQTAPTPLAAPDAPAGSPALPQQPAAMQLDHDILQVSLHPAEPDAPAGVLIPSVFSTGTVPAADPAPAIVPAPSVLPAQAHADGTPLPAASLA